jgi:hypothetical protein
MPGSTERDTGREVGNVVVTRVPYMGPPRRSRTLEERVLVRFPSLYRRLATVVFGLLSPRSRLRRVLIRRAIVSGWHATSRGDFELVPVRYADDAEIEFEADFEAIGLAGPFRGHEGILQRDKAFQQEWGRFEALPGTVLDRGDLIVVLGTLRLTGKASGLELDREVAQLITLRGGLAVRDRIFLSWERGLRAAGLDPDASVLPPGKAGEAASGR